MPRRLFTCLALTLALTGCAILNPYATKIEPPPGPVLFDMLKGGGYVIFFRHGATSDYAEAEPVDFTSCTRQRNLNAAGQEQATRIGQAFRQLGLPVGAVIASPYCRTMDSARLAFGRVEAADEARFKEYRDKLAARAAAAQAAKTNLIVVGHASAIGLIGSEMLREAEAVIVRPLGGGMFEPVARIEVDQWLQLLPANHPPQRGR